MLAKAPKATRIQPPRIIPAMKLAPAVCFFGLALFGCGEPEAPPSIVLVVVDTLRLDGLGIYGNEHDTSPFIDSLAQESLVFDNARAVSSWTAPSMASLFTSLLPSEHGAVSIAQPLDAGVRTLTERLSAGGYRTVGISGNFVHVSRESGLSRGFDRFAALPLRAREADDVILRIDQGEAPPLELRAPTAAEVNQLSSASLPSRTAAPSSSTSTIWTLTRATWRPKRSARDSATPRVPAPARSRHPTTWSTWRPAAPSQSL